MDKGTQSQHNVMIVFYKGLNIEQPEPSRKCIKETY